MNRERAAVEAHLPALVKSLNSSEKAFYEHLRNREVISESELEMVRSEELTDGRLRKMLTILNQKDLGFEAIIAYLSESHRNTLCNDLLRASGRPTHKRETPSPDLIKTTEMFRRYYKDEYTKVEKHGVDDNDQTKNIENFWVDIEMKQSRKSAPFGYIQLIKHLLNNYSKIFITGAPGAGKTTLLKRIAWDWAQPKTIVPSVLKRNKIEKIELLLLFPLDSLKTPSNITSMDDLILLIAEYFVQQFPREEFLLSPEEFKNRLMTLGDKLLICLDGLDALANRVKDLKFFQALFAPWSSFKLLVTTRPCDVITIKKYFNLRVEILSLSQRKLSIMIGSLVSDRRGDIVECLKSGEILESTPRLVNFACKFAETCDKLNMTKLYIELHKHLVKAYNISDQDEDWWNCTPIVSTAKLALAVCQKKIHKFDQKLVRQFGCEKSFICGILQCKIDSEDVKMAEFHQQSAQEFFAALRCYQLMLESSSDSEKISAIAQVCLGAKQLRRFFFGLCSQMKKFDSVMLPWLNDQMIGTLSRMGFCFDYSQFTSNSFVDCENDQKQKMKSLLNEKVKVARPLPAFQTLIAQQKNIQGSDGFFELYNQIDTKNLKQPWSPSLDDKIALVFGKIKTPENPENSVEKIGMQITTLMWRFGWMNGGYLKEILSELNKFPNLKNIYLMEINGDREVSICVNDLSKSELNFFNFRYVRTQFKKLKEIVDGYEGAYSFSPIAITLPIENVNVIWAVVTIMKSESLNNLVIPLLKLALDLDPDKSKK